MSTVADMIKADHASTIDAKVVPARIAHFVLRTPNAKPLIDWYTCVFEADAVFNNGSMAFLYFDDEHHRIAIIEVPDLGAYVPTSAAIDHVAFSYESIRDLLHTYTRLKSHGIEPFAKLDHGPTTSFYYRDPDGNQVELQVDNFATRERAHAYFQSKAFMDNPIGVEINPDDMVAQLDAGIDPELLLSLGTRGAI